MEHYNPIFSKVPTLRFPEFAGEWQDTTLGNVCVYRKTRRTAEKKNYISTENILQNYQGVERFTSNESISGDGFNKNDILMGNIRPYLKKVYYADFDGVCNADVLVFKSNFINPHFLYCRLANDTFINYVMKSVKGSKMPRGDKSHIMQYPLSIPGEAEQSKISNFIELLTSRIQVQNKIIEDLKVLKKELCNDHFKSVLRDTSLQYIALKEILTERKEYCSKDGTYTHGTLSKEGVAPKTERYDRDFLVKNEDKQYKVTHLNDICYNPANLKFGVICRNTYGDLIFSPIYVTFEISDNVCPAYIELFLTNSNFIGRIRRYEQGTVYERMAVSPEDFLSYETHMPTYEEQVKFANKMQCIQRKIELETAFLSSLQRQRKYLLTAMFI